MNLKPCTRIGTCMDRYTSMLESAFQLCKGRHLGTETRNSTPYLSRLPLREFLQSPVSQQSFKGTERISANFGCNGQCKGKGRGSKAQTLKDLLYELWQASYADTR